MTLQTTQVQGKCVCLGGSSTIVVPSSNKSVSMSAFCQSSCNQFAKRKSYSTSYNY